MRRKPERAAERTKERMIDLSLLCYCGRSDLGQHTLGFCEQVRKAEPCERSWCDECGSFE